MERASAPLPSPFPPLPHGDYSDDSSPVVYTRKLLDGAGRTRAVLTFTGIELAIPPVTSLAAPTLFDTPVIATAYLIGHRDGPHLVVRLPEDLQQPVEVALVAAGEA